MNNEPNEETPLRAKVKEYGSDPAPDTASDWRHPTNNSIFFDALTFSSLEEMKGSLLESCCPGDGVLSAAVSLITTACTPSMLSIPLAFVIGGWTFAACSTLFCVVMTLMSVRILALASVSADSDDYETVTGFFLGHRGKLAVRFILFFYSFGSSVVYLGFIKESLKPILAGRATFLPQWMRGELGACVCLLLSMILITPLTYNSRLASLRTKGLVSNLFSFFIIFAIAYRYFSPVTVPDGGAPATDAPGESEVLKSPFSNKTITQLLPYMFTAPIFVFSYEVQTNVMGVIKDLQDRTGQKILLAISLALLVVSVIYVSLGIFGSLTFPTLDNGNILTAYDAEHDLLMTACQCLCCFCAAISFVFCLFPCRLATFMFLTGGKNPKIPKKKRVQIGTALSVTAAITAVFIPDVAKIVSFMGALFSATLCMTLPAIFAIHMHNSGTYLTGMVDGLANWLLLIVGVGFSVVGTFMAVVFSS